MFSCTYGTPCFWQIAFTCLRVGPKLPKSLVLDGDHKYIISHMISSSMFSIVCIVCHDAQTSWLHLSLNSAEPFVRIHNEECAIASLVGGFNICKQVAHWGSSSQVRGMGKKHENILQNQLCAGNNTGQCMSCSVQFRGPVPSLSFATTSSPTVKRNSNGVVVAAVQSHKQHAAPNVWAKSIKAPETKWNLEQLEDMSYWVPSTKSTAAATNCNEYVGLRQGFSRSFLVHCLMIDD